MTVLADLKWKGQYSKLMQALTMCTNLSKHVLYEIRDLRCLHKTWSGPGVDVKDGMAEDRGTE